jgi:ABC-type uncharacterized transport system substrate-binding protein
VALLVLSGTRSAAAHPHALVVYSIVLSLAPPGLEGVGVAFTFERGHPSRRGGGRSGGTSRHHARILQQIPFEIEIAFNGASVALEPPTDLHVSITGGRVTYRFVVPLRRRLLPPGTIDIRVEDPGLFAAFVLSGTDPVELQDAGAFTATCARAQTPTGALGPLRCQ